MGKSCINRPCGSNPGKWSTGLHLAPERMGYMWSTWLAPVCKARVRSCGSLFILTKYFAKRIGDLTEGTGVFDSGEDGGHNIFSGSSFVVEVLQ